MSLYATVRDFLFREARYLDDAQWDQWLEMYASDCTFWMPSWDDDDTLTEDPHSEISLIWYGNRGGLEDRVFRIKTERSSATVPDTRTSHNISNVEILAEEGAKLTVRFNWLTFSFRYHTTHTYYGCSEYDLDVSGNEPLITRKYVVLKNDYINQLIDVYHV